LAKVVEGRCPTCGARASISYKGHNSYWDKLTDREIEILSTLIDEGTGKATAFKLEISEQTVKNTLANMRNKLGAENTMQMVYMLVTGPE